MGTEDIKLLGGSQLDYFQAQKYHKCWLRLSLSDLNNYIISKLILFITVGQRETHV